MADEKTIKRISLTPSAFDMIRDFCRGLNMEYSECLEFMYQQLAQKDEQPIETGLRLRKQQEK